MIAFKKTIYDAGKPIFAQPGPVVHLDDLEVERLTEALRSAFVDSATGEAVLDEFRVLLEKAQPRQVKRST